MHGAVGGARFVEIAFQRLHGPCVGDAQLLAPLFQRGHRARPYDIVDGQFAAKHHLTVVVDVDDGSQAWVVESEEIEERAVLAEAVGVVGIIHAHFLIAQEEQQSATHVFFEFRPAAGEGVFSYHG